MPSNTTRLSMTSGDVPGGAPAFGWFRLKYLVFAVIFAMMAYVLVHNERFIIDPTHPVWNHYEPFKWWLLPHGIAGACVLFLAPLQFSNRLRARHITLHRTVGGIYVIAVMVLAPIGVLIQYYVEAQGAARSFTIETVIQSALLLTTTGLALLNILQGNVTRHRQWMFRSYAVALTFLEVRVILGVFGLDNPIDWHVVETVVWSCAAAAILLGDIANEIYERQQERARPSRA